MIAWICEHERFQVSIAELLKGPEQSVFGLHCTKYSGIRGDNLHLWQVLFICLKDLGEHPWTATPQECKVPVEAAPEKEQVAIYCKAPTMNVIEGK